MNLASLDLAGQGWHLVQIHVGHADWDPDMEGDPFDDWYEVLLHPRCAELLTPMDGHGIAHEFHCGLQHEIDNAGAETVFDGMSPGLHLVRCWVDRGHRGPWLSEVSIEFDHVALTEAS